MRMRGLSHAHYYDYIIRTLVQSLVLCNPESGISTSAGPESGVVESGLSRSVSLEAGVVECGVQSPRSLLIPDFGVRYYKIWRLACNESGLAECRLQNLGCAPVLRVTHSATIQYCRYGFLSACAYCEISKKLCS